MSVPELATGNRRCVCWWVGGDCGDLRPDDHHLIYGDNAQEMRRSTHGAPAAQAVE
jgi:hypothetical protein